MSVQISSWLWAWIAWGLLFLVIEIPASLNHIKGDTLSEQVWRFIGFGRPLTGWTRARRIAFLLLWAWLTAHFLFQWA